MSELLRAEGLSKEYQLPQGKLCVFKDFHFSVEQGDLIAVMGASGVGKSTLLNLFGALDRPTAGTVYLEGEDLFEKSDKELAEIRNLKIGFIFQFYHLLPEFSAQENVAFPLLIGGIPRRTAFDRARGMLAEVGLSEKILMRPGQLSGGEQQRIAIARALVNHPRLLLADEPTGNLDWKTGRMILKLILDLHQKKGLSSIIVTHNDKVAQFCRKVYHMENGMMKL